MRLDVTTQPVPFNIAGEQNDFLIYNAGPDTVYLDNDGSVSADTSMPLPPLSYLPWKRGVSTWIVSRGLSRITVTPTTDAPAGNTASRQQSVFTSLGATTSTTNLNDMTESDLIECSAYQSIVINYTCDVTFAISGANIRWVVDWYDSSQAFLSRDTYYMWPPAGGVSISSRINRLTVPVRGAFFRLYSLCIAQTFNYTLNIVGSTVELPLSLNPSFGFSDSDVPVGFVSSGIVTEWSADYALIQHVAGTWSAWYMKTLKRNLRVQFDFQSGANPTGAGSIAVYNANQGFRITQSQTIAAASRYQEFTFSNLPLTLPLYMTFPTNPTATLNPTMQMIWSD